MPSPTRIVSLISSATEILAALGLIDRLVAVSHECDYPNEVADKPKVTVSHIHSERSSRAIDEQVRSQAEAGAALYGIDRQKLVDLAPDLIVTQAQCDVCAVRYDDVVAVVRENEPLRETEIIALNPESLQDVFRDIKRLGEATSTRSEATRFVESLQQRVDGIREMSRAIADSQRPRVVCIEWIEPLMVAANWMPEMIQDAGGQCDLTRGGQHSVYSSWDEVVDYDPEVIVVMPCGFALERTVTEATSLACRDAWHELSAVRNGRVYAVDGNSYFNRSGPRLVDSLELLAHFFHPHRCAVPAHLHEAWCRLSSADGVRGLA